MRPQSIDFDIEEEKLWKPFLTERSRAELFGTSEIDSIQTTIQPEFYPELQRLQGKLAQSIQDYLI